MPPIVEVINLLKKYGDLTAVDGISFTIQEGEIFRLLVPNSAGKTTTISILSTLFSPTAGEAIICGHSVTKKSAGGQTSHRCVPQEIALYEDLTALENLNFWGKMWLVGRDLSGVLTRCWS